MKKSKKTSKLLDLERDLPTALEDIVALKRVGAIGHVNSVDYLDFLESAARLVDDFPRRGRKGPQGDEPFTLGWLFERRGKLE